MRHVWLLAVLAAACWCSRPALAQQTAASSEYEAKAVFLLNFLKYVEWPPMTESDTNALVAAEAAGLKISSRLLAVADVVKRK